jgi:hypothetical protein
MDVKPRASARRAVCYSKPHDAPPLPALRPTRAATTLTLVGVEQRHDERRLVVAERSRSRFAFSRAVL